MNGIFKGIGLLTLGILAVSSCGARTPTSESIDPNNYTNDVYQNPLYVADVSGKYYSAEIADPCVVRDEKGEFWSFSTCRRVLHSVDGCNWEKYSDAIIQKPQWGNEHFAAAGKSGAELWPPTPGITQLGMYSTGYATRVFSVMELSL